MERAHRHAHELVRLQAGTLAMRDSGVADDRPHS
jgi:hypothetical protein